MPFVAPWLRPVDTLGAIQAGSQTGLSQRQADQADAARELAANQAAERLRLSYDSLAQAREQQLRQDAAQRERFAASAALTKAREDAMAAYRNAELANQSRRITDAERTQSAAEALKASERNSNRNVYNDLASGTDPLISLANNPDANHSVFAPYVADALKTRQFQNAPALTKGTQSKLEQGQLEADNTFQIGQKLAGLLTYGNTGVPGNLNRAGDAIMGLIPGHKVGSSTEAKTLAIDFGAKLTRALRSDGNIAEPERKQIMEALPRPQDWSESASSAKSKLATALEQAMQISRDSALKRNVPITPHFLMPVEIREMLASGKINGKQADSLMENNAWRLINTLKDESQR